MDLFCLQGTHPLHLLGESRAVNKHDPLKPLSPYHCEYQGL